MENGAYSLIIESFDAVEPSLLSYINLPDRSQLVTPDGGNPHVRCVGRGPGLRVHGEAIEALSNERDRNR